MKYWEELCVSDAKISNFRLIWPARIHFIFFSKFLAWRYRHYEANQPRIVSIKYVYQHDFVDWLRRITCFRRKTGAKCQNFGSLAPLARNNFFLSSLWFSGRNKSSWRRPYHMCTNTGTWFIVPTNHVIYQQNVSDQKYQNFWFARSKYSFSMSFGSLALFARNHQWFFSTSFWSVTRVKSILRTHCIDKL